ncbi:MAG: TolC family protein [Verrucomicrobia bacterium]|nr:TolC family protein [Verrucomicrobiota bacterium]
MGVLTGCARFQSQPLAPAETASKLEARTLHNPDLKKFLEKNLHRELTTWPLKSWDFSALTLVAFYYHPSLDVAHAQYGVAQAGVITAGGKPNPTVGLVPEYTVNAARGMSPWLAGVNFDIPIETANKRGYRITRARHLSEATRLNIATVAWQVRSNLRRSLLDYTISLRREEILKTQQTTQTEMVKLMAQRLAAGAIAPTELSTARIGLDKTRLELGTAQSQSAEGRARVAEALGLPLSALDEVGLALDLERSAPADLTTTEARREALQSRADILSALAEYAASQSALQLEIARQYADIHLNPGYQFDQGENKWALGLSAELPVLNQNQGPITEAKARRTEAAARFTALQANVIAEIDRVTAAYRVAQEQLATGDSLLATQKKQGAAALSQFQAGAIDRLELLGAQLELGGAELLRLEGLARTQLAVAALEDAVQRPVLEYPDLPAQSQTRKEKKP